MPTKRTKGMTAVFLELPDDLIERVKDFAKRDMRSIKAEFIRALELLLDTYDRPGAQATIPTPRETTLPLNTSAGLSGRPGALEDLPALDEETFQKVLHRLKNPELCALARQLRAGITLAQIFAANPGQGAGINKQLNKVENVVRSMLRDAARN